MKGKKYKSRKECFQKILNTKEKRFCVTVVLLISIALVGGTITRITESKNSNAVNVIIKYLDAKKNNDFKAWKNTLWLADGKQDITSLYEKEGDLGVISLAVNKVNISDDETKRIKERFTGSELARYYEWTDEYIAENMIAVIAKYYVDYDNTKVPYNEGTISQYFYLIRADQDSPWFIWEQSYDVNE